MMWIWVFLIGGIAALGGLTLFAAGATLFGVVGALLAFNGACMAAFAASAFLDDRSGAELQLE